MFKNYFNSIVTIRDEIMGIFNKKQDFKPQANDIQIPIITINSLGDILYSNASANNLFEVSNAVDKNITDLILADLPSIMKGSNSIRQAFKTVINPDKFCTVSVKQNTTGNYFILTFNEVSKDYNLLNKLIEYRANTDNLGKNKNIFLAQMSNVFKSPMHSIMGYSQAILEGMGGETDERQRKYLSIIYRNSDELFGLMDKITELSKIEAQMTEFSFKNYDITNLLSVIKDEYSSVMHEKGLNLVVDTDNLAQKVIYGDEYILKTILVHLIENSLLSCAFGDITITLSDAEYAAAGEKFMKIKITDSRTPINVSEMPYAFNPYFQPDKKNRKTLLQGLSICIAGNLVSQLNGKITAETDVSGFTIVLPTDNSVESSLKV